MNTPMPDLQLNWAEATVKDSKLTVPLKGDVPKGWKDHFKTTVKLLANEEWGEVEVSKEGVRVERVGSGEEDKLRFYLEGVVAQANAAVDAERERKRSKQREGSERSPKGADAELTERYRSFADEDGDGDSE